MNTRMRGRLAHGVRRTLLFRPVPTRSPFLVPALLVMGATAAWWAHARAWDLGGRSPVLNYDSAQYALAARALAFQGRLETTFALPLELAKHPRPPWPLAVVQPGTVLVEAALFRVFGAREWLVLVVPALGYVAIALFVFAIGRRLAGAAAGAVAAAAFILDPEAQHFATGGFTEIPFTLALLAGLALIAGGAASRRPLAFGLLLGAGALFRAQMTFFLPVLALAAGVT